MTGFSFCPGELAQSSTYSAPMRQYRMLAGYAIERELPVDYCRRRRRTSRSSNPVAAPAAAGASFGARHRSIQICPGLAVGVGVEPPRSRMASGTDGPHPWAPRSATVGIPNGASTIRLRNIDPAATAEDTSSLTTACSKSLVRRLPERLGLELRNRLYIFYTSGRSLVGFTR